MQGNRHKTVLLHEAVDGLSLKADAIVVDATFGGGGHSELICTKLGKNGRLIALDADESAFVAAKEVVRNDERVTFINRNFRDIDVVLEELGLSHVDGVLADLGWRIEQFEDGGKGFSFQKDEPLAMTYGKAVDYPFTARDIVNDWSEEVLTDVLVGYGEERFARRIVRGIIAAREIAPIETSGQLAEVIGNAVPAFYRHGKTNAATRTFQALRIATNDELEALREFIQKALDVLKPGGRLAIITFHSIEDRIVKHTFRGLEHDHYGHVVTKKAVVPTDAELEENPRARSAKLRIFEKQYDTQGNDNSDIQGREDMVL